MQQGTDRPRQNQADREDTQYEQAFAQWLLERRGEIRLAQSQPAAHRPASHVQYACPRMIYDVFYPIRDVLGLRPHPVHPRAVR